MTLGRTWSLGLLARSYPRWAWAGMGGGGEFDCFLLKLSASWGIPDPQTLPAVIS